MPCCHVVLGSSYSSSHLFVPFLQTQYLWNTLRKCLSFPFMTVFLTKECPGFDRSKAKSQSNWLCRCWWGCWFPSCLEYEGLGLKGLLLLYEKKSAFLQIQIFGMRSRWKGFLNQPLDSRYLKANLFPFSGGWHSSSSSSQQSPRLLLPAETTPVCVSTATGC